MCKYLLTVLLAVGLTTGCRPTIYDVRGPDEFCEVHHALMHAEQIPAPKFVMPSREYLEARAKLFPHAYPFYLPKPKGQYVVNICDYCVHAEKLWKSHNDEK
jgi:hypothetical protein